MFLILAFVAGWFLGRIISKIRIKRRLEAGANPKRWAWVTTINKRVYLHELYAGLPLLILSVWKLGSWLGPWWQFAGIAISFGITVAEVICHIVYHINLGIPLWYWRTNNGKT